MKAANADDNIETTGGTTRGKTSHRQSGIHKSRRLEPPKFGDGTASATAAEEKAYRIFRNVLERSTQIEAFISNPRRARDPLQRQEDDKRTLSRIRRASARTAARCMAARTEMDRSNTPPTPINPSILRFAAAYPLEAYRGFERYIPRIVNVVSVAKAIPIPGMGTTLPLSNDVFRTIATKCTGAYYAPRRFSNIQLGFREPRARVLVFQTGQLVTTGTNGIASTRLIVNLAIDQLAREAGVHLRVESFAVKNMVASCSLDATFNCEGFSQVHTSETNYDRSSFAGMTWRPADFSPGCVEIYSTGKANIPGTKSQRELLEGFGKLIHRLLRFSSASHAPFTSDSGDPMMQEQEDVLNINDVEEEACNPALRDEDVDLWNGWGC